MNFSFYQTLARQKSGFAIDEQWAQGRSVFGGLSAALILTHIEAQTGLTDKDLRTFNVHFCGAIIADEECQLKFEVLSSGKSICQVQGQLLQDGKVKTQVMACFGVQRTSAISVPSRPLGEVKPPEDASKMPFIQGIMPNYLSHMDIRFTSKNMPFTNSENSTVSGWMRFNEANDIFSDAAILALVDVWPPAILPMLKQPAPASSVTWNIEFVQPRSELNPQDFLYYECDVVLAEQGYAHTDGKVYHPNGQLLALTRQLVAVYDKK